MKVRRGDIVIVKNNDLKASGREFGMDSAMNYMRGHSYEVTSVVEHGVKIDGYWFSFQDLIKESDIKDKPEQIVHFNEDNLCI